MVATIAGLNLFQQKIDYDGQDSMLKKGEQIIEMYEEYDGQDRGQFFQQMAELTSYPIHLYESKDDYTFFTLSNNNLAEISQESVDEVLQGNVYLSNNKQKDTYVGFPIKLDGKEAAIFLQFSYENEMIFNYLLFFIIICTLVIGSLLILIAARYLILPLKKLKEATDLIADGNFEVSLDVKRQDEIGELAKSFNQMAEELKQIEEMRQDFVSNVSHEIQSPLTSISGFAKALKNEELISDEQRPYYLDIIISESERLSRLGDNLLKLASLDSEHHPFNAERFDVIEQVRQVVVTLEPQWSRKKIEVILINQAPMFIEGDFDLLQQVWLNIITNSIKFTPEFGEITVVAVKDEELIITIKDTGMGIPEKELSHIFQRFYKTDKSRTAKEKGNGLGLVIVKKIIELHQGKIVITSELNKGTEVTIQLPIIS